MGNCANSSKQNKKYSNISKEDRIMIKQLAEQLSPDEFDAFIKIYRFKNEQKSIYDRNNKQRSATISTQDSPQSSCHQIEEFKNILKIYKQQQEDEEQIQEMLDYRFQPYLLNNVKQSSLMLKRKQQKSKQKLQRRSEVVLTKFDKEKQINQSIRQRKISFDEEIHVQQQQQYQEQQVKNQGVKNIPNFPNSRNLLLATNI